MSPPQAVEGSLTPHKRYTSRTIITWVVPGLTPRHPHIVNVYFFVEGYSKDQYLERPDLFCYEVSVKFSHVGSIIHDH